MRRRFATALLPALFLSTAAFAARPAAALDAWIRPVTGPVERPFRAPTTRFGKGHLGVDFTTAPGTPVRAAGAGNVVFAGVVAGARYVVVRHAGGLRTSYAFLASIRVEPGQAVRRGAVLGTSGGRGENHVPDVLHFGLRIGDVYVDPMQLFTGTGDPTDLSTRVHLAPVGEAAVRPHEAPPSPRPAAPAALRRSERISVPVGDHRIAR